MSTMIPVFLLVALFSFGIGYGIGFIAGEYFAYTSRRKRRST